MAVVGYVSLITFLFVPQCTSYRFGYNLSACNLCLHFHKNKGADTAAGRH
jgi:hypothetical protein